MPFRFVPQRIRAVNTRPGIIGPSDFRPAFLAGRLTRGFYCRRTSERDRAEPGHLGPGTQKRRCASLHECAEVGHIAPMGAHGHAARFYFRPVRDKSTLLVWSRRW